MKYVYGLIQLLALSVWIPAVDKKVHRVYYYFTEWVDLSPFAIKCTLSIGIFLIANMLMWKAIQSERVGHE